MSRTYQMSEIRDRVEALVDDDGNDLASEAQYLDWLNEAYAWLWSELVSSGIYPEVKFHNITSTAATGVYDLALDNYAVFATHYQRGTDDWVKLYPFHYHDFHRLAGPEASHASWYMVHGTDQIHLLSQHPAGQAYRVHYVPACPKLSAPTDIINGVAGWEELIVLDAAVKARLRDNDSVKEFQVERAKVLARLQRHKDHLLLEAMAVPRTPSQTLLDPASARPFRRY